MGGQVGSDIRVGRDLSDNADEAQMDEAARQALAFSRFAEEGVAFVREVGKPNVKVMLDTFHMNIEEDSFGKARSGRRARCSAISTQAPSFTDPAASAATTGKAGSGPTMTPFAPLKSAQRRNAVDGMDKPPARPPRPRGRHKSGRSGHLMCCQNRTSSFAIDSDCTMAVADHWVRLRTYIADQLNEWLPARPAPPPPTSADAVGVSRECLPQG